MAYQYNYSYNSNSAFSYVKKEDAKSLLKNRRYLGYIFGLCFLFIFAIFEFLVFKSQSLPLINLGVELPFYSQPSFRYTVFTAIIASCFFVQPEPEEEFNKKLQQYKAGEMILVSNLVDKSYEQKIGLAVFLGFAYLVAAIILPISTLVGTV